MNPGEAAFLKKLNAAFRIEAEEHLQTISTGLLELEKTPEPVRRSQIVSRIFREAHSLKGAARAVNADEIENICQSLEGVFSQWRRFDFVATAESLDPLHLAVNAAVALLASGSVDGVGLSAEETSSVLSKLKDLETVASGLSEEVNSALQATRSIKHQPKRRRKQSANAASSQQSPGPAVVPAQMSPSPPMAPEPLIPPPVSRPASAAAPAGPETVRIATDKLDAVLLQVEEMLAVKLTARQRSAELRALLETVMVCQRQCSKVAPVLRAILEPIANNGKSDSRRLAHSIEEISDFVEWTDEQMKLLEGRLAGIAKSSDHDRRFASAMVDTLLEDTKKLLMLPCATLLEAIPKMVRDLSRDQGKDIDLVQQGDDVEIDKRVLSEMRDPLVHLLRNAVDHGIEDPARRQAAGKSARGTIRVTVSPVDGNKIEIVVADDGGGIDPGDVRDAAVRQGVITADAASHFGEQETLGLIFRPEVSTSRMITEISGRGLGLSIVKEKVERLGGRIDMETRKGQGTTFRIHLPLTLSTFRGLLVQCAGQSFVIPAANVERVLRVKSAEVQTVEMRETIPLNGKVLSLVRLGDVLGLVRPPEPARAGATTFAIAVLAIGERRVAFRVDEIVSEQEVLVKRLAKPLVRVRNVAGATVLGTGKAVPILNVDDLLKSAGKAGRSAVSTSTAEMPARETGIARSILVAEDSITARMLVKNILEAAGYVVKTAVDGLEALTILKTEAFDLVLSDVEMPRMNGFQLTEKIRADARLSELPVVLVTALASREDRERGVEAGANAYIVKSSFDQGNLLEIIQRLL